MLVKPSVTELLGKIESRYRLVTAISKRARQISKGAVVLTNRKERSSVTLAAYEVAEEKVFIECE